MIGKTISPYKILEKLGAGGMGVVYKAQDTKLDRFIALKFLPPHLSEDEEEKQRFKIEAQAAAVVSLLVCLLIFKILKFGLGKYCEDCLPVLVIKSF